MPRTYQRFPNRERAEGFRLGVEHANDSALEVIDVYEAPDPAEPDEPWVVEMEDEDADEPELSDTEQATLDAELDAEMGRCGNCGDELDGDRCPCCGFVATDDDLDHPARARDAESA